MIEPLFKKRIELLAGGRVFPGVAPTGTNAPYMTYTRVGGDRDWVLAGPSGSQHVSIQLNVWASDPKTAGELMQQAFELLSAPGPDFKCTGADDIPANDDELTTKLHGASMEFFLIR